MSTKIRPATPADPEEIAMLSLRLAVLAAATTAAFTAAAMADTAAASTMPPDNPARGQVYTDLEAGPPGDCARAFRLATTGGCTPGPDAAYAGFDVAVDVAARPERNPKVQCDADSTLRVQVVYARASDTPDRYADFADSIRQWAGEVDEMVRDAAAETGGERHVRFVHDADCVVDVANVVMDPGADDSFDATIADLESRGLRSTTRKYLVFVDANVYCGIAEVADDDSDSRLNRNNKGPDYARVDAGCWSGTVAAHELMHTLGAVQLSAPASNRHFGCTASTHDLPIDCDLSNYFDTNPPKGSYLTTHWNVATSSFLVRSRQNLWGYVAAELPTNAGYTPSLRRQRNSTNATNTVQRTGTGAYTVTFANLGVTGGTVNVTAMSQDGRMCKVADWGHRLADLEVRVRCYTLNGTAADVPFTATYARPGAAMPGKRFAHVWADRASAASYTPDARYSYNSEGSTNTITRSGTGRYRVHLPGVGGAGGSANVTAYGTGSASCKLVAWQPNGSEERVDVACHTAAGAAVDSRFTMTFHEDDGILGVTTDGVSPRAHVLASQPSSASYTPALAEQFSATGGPITIRHSWPGWYSVQMPGFEMLGGNPQVTALSFTGDSVRCQLHNWSTSWSSMTGPATNVSVRCFDAAGANVDAPFAMSFVR